MLILLYFIKYDRKWKQDERGKQREHTIQWLKKKIDTHNKSKENKNSRNYMYTNFLLDKK